MKKSKFRLFFQGITVADINEKMGVQVTQKLKKKYGSNKVIFVKTDTSDKKSFEGKFQL